MRQVCQHWRKKARFGGPDLIRDVDDPLAVIGFRRLRNIVPVRPACSDGLQKCSNSVRKRILDIFAERNELRKVGRRYQKCPVVGCEIDRIFRHGFTAYCGAIISKKSPAGGVLDCTADFQCTMRTGMVAFSRT